MCSSLFVTSLEPRDTGFTSFPHNPVAPFPGILTIVSRVHLSLIEVCHRKHLTLLNV